MEDHFLSSTSSHFTNHFSVPDMDPSRRAHRHHSNGMVMGCGYDRPKKLQSDNEYLRERVKSCETGLGRIYQTIVNSGKQQKSHKGSSHHRSASLTYQFGSNYASPSPTKDLNQFNDIGTELDEITCSLPQVTISEVQSAVEKLLSERENLLSEVDDLKQITEAAKRERVLAIDEKDQLLRETHTLRVTVEASQTTLNQYEEERSARSEQLKSVQEELTSLKRDNEQANQLRSRALEERSKIIEECAGLQDELRTLQAERAELYEETGQLQHHMEDMGREKRRLEQELEWLSQKSLGYEAEARTLQEQNEFLSGKGHDVLELHLVRDSLDQPWGFTVEGGRGTEFYHQDPSIVVTGVASHTPAEYILRYGDRILMFDNHNFRNLTRKEAVEKIRSCDLTTVAMEIGRPSTNTKPAPMDVKIPGRRDFGFSYETRLFVTSTEEGSPSMGYLLPGDEITQVQGKSAFNMKSSVLKQLLKSCKDGLTLTIQRQPGINPASLSPSNLQHATCQAGLNGTTNGHSPTCGPSLESKAGLLHPMSRPAIEFVQSPGTPKSNVSEMSMGYHSLTHSVPSEVSNGIAHLGQPELSGAESTGLHLRGQTQALNIPERDGFARHRPADGLSFTSPQMRSHTLSGPPQGGLNKSSYRSRPADFYSPRRNTTNSYSRSGLGLRPRPCSNSIPRTSISPNFSSRMENGHMQHFLYPQKVTSLTRGARPTTTHFTENSGKPFSFSADNLDSDDVIPENSPIRKSQTPKHEKSHSREGADSGPRSPPAKYSRGRGMLSISMGNMQTHV